MATACADMLCGGWLRKNCDNDVLFGWLSDRLFAGRRGPVVCICSSMIAPGLLAMRIDESLYYANAQALEDLLLSAVADCERVRHVVLICSAVNFIDTSALETLENLVDELRDGGVTLHLAEVKGPVMDGLEKVSLLERMRPGRVFLSTHEAVQALAEPGDP